MSAPDHVKDIISDCRLAEEMLDRYFTALFALKQEKYGHLYDFSALDSQLKNIFKSLIGQVELEWQRALDNDTYDKKDMEEIAKAWGRCQDFFTSQKNQLFDQDDGGRQAVNNGK